MITLIIITEISNAPAFIMIATVAIGANQSIPTVYELGQLQED